MTVYFISDGEFVKIGYTKGEPSKRLKSLQTGHPKSLKLLKSVPGDSGTERECHEALARYRASGEWFRLCRPVQSFIKSFSGSNQPSASILTEARVYQELMRYGYHGPLCSEEAIDEWARVEFCYYLFIDIYAEILMPSGLKYLYLQDDIRSWLSHVREVGDDLQEAVDGICLGYDINQLYMPGSGCSIIIDTLDRVFKVDTHKLRYEPADKLYAIYRKWFEPHYYNDANWRDHCAYAAGKYGDHYVTQRQDAFWSFIDNVVARAHIDHHRYLRLVEPEIAAYFNALFCSGNLRLHLKNYIRSLPEGDLSDIGLDTLGMPSREEMVAAFFYFCQCEGYRCSYTGQGCDPQIVIPV